MPRTAMRVVWVFSLGLWFTACLPRVGPAVDGGEPDETDAGQVAVDGGPGEDGGVVSCTNGRRDGDETAVDCGGACAAHCANGEGCATSLDCASGVCAGATCTAALADCSGYSGCTTFVDATDAAASRVVSFPAGGERYSPQCLKVRFGQSVTFQGNFSNHPLAAACAPTVNPVARTTNGSSASFTFDRGLGVYGYYCSQHGSTNGNGMAGAVMVVR